MQKFSLFPAVVLSLVSFISVGIQPVWADNDAGFVSLFDGKTLDSWMPIGLGKAKFQVKDSAIYGKTAKGSPNTFLASKKQYADFERHFDVKVHDKLNSGIQIRSRPKTKEEAKANGSDIGRIFGPQIEIEASPGQAAYVYGEATGRGWLSPKPKDKSHSHDFMKNGEWNSFKIIAKGPRIQTWINGNMVEDLTDEEIYKTHPKGHLGLQVHGIGKKAGPFDVSWKNIKIKEL